MRISLDPYVVNMMLGTSVAAHISLLHAGIIAHARDPFSEFHNITDHVCRLLWSLLVIAMWADYRIHSCDFIMMGASGWDRLRL